MRSAVRHLLLVVAAAWVGCSSDRESFQNKPDDFGDPDAGLDAGCSGVVCSRDLRSVRDCDDNLVKECPAETACGNGECLAPCDAVAANEGSIGCSFAVPPYNGPLDAYAGSCRAFFVANNWTSPAAVRIEYKGEEKSLDGALWEPFVEDGVVKHRKLDGPIPPGGGAVVFVSHEDLWNGSKTWVSCPEGVKPIFDKEGAVYGTGIGQSLLVRADVPVSMYLIHPYGGAKSTVPGATLLLPTTSFRKNYVLTSSWGGKSDTFGKGRIEIIGATLQTGRPTIQIVATEDDTAIDLLPRVDIVGGKGVHPSPRDEVASYTLRRGEVLQLTQDNELVGSILETSKPVAVFGGQTCMRVPADVPACENDNEQIPPLSAWGHEYAVWPAPDRTTPAGGAPSERDPSVVRLVGAANGTKLVYEPTVPEGAPDELEAGQIARFFADDAFVVRSQDAEHPFYVATVMTGAALVASAWGDPETTIMVPTDQWLDSYGFYSDYSYELSSISVARRKSNGVFQDVTLDCAGVLTGWKPITADYEWTTVVLTRRGRSQTYPAGKCNDGAHQIKSDGAFSIAVWGLSPSASYSYSGGTGLRPATQLHVPVR
jgi:IgGFc binding protein